MIVLNNYNAEIIVIGSSLQIFWSRIGVFGWIFVFFGIQFKINRVRSDMIYSKFTFTGDQQVSSLS